jgi:hypothetical protein
LRHAGSLLSGEGGIRFPPFPQELGIAQFKAAKPIVPMLCAFVFDTNGDQGFSPVVSRFVPLGQTQLPLLTRCNSKEAEHVQEGT